ncbi:DUF3237 domain-containing protein [Thiomonas sp. FB-6]|uniref:DUF3237 domain-containing protein n=1 Tax=Thiomonas sp. FB-6 TaxID=1158291 RepID=UPI00036EADD0|nr:DUF3237 domain-containing protein [Thiomonas sp. FB-6]
MQQIPTPGLEWFADFEVEVGAPIEVGRTQHGLRRLIPILGGSARGEGWSASVLPGGADHQAVLTPRLVELDARYVLRTDGGDCIYVHNRAIRCAPEAVTARLMRGEPVPPEEVYFRCTPSFEASAPAWQWITEQVFLGSGVRTPDKVLMRFFRVL